VTELLLRRLDAQPGQSVLEVGAGVGEVGRLVAERVGSRGHVLQTDQAAALVAAARRRAEGAANVSFAVADAQALDLEDASLDGVVSRFAFMLVPDPALALAETHRVLRPGGRLAFAVWASAPENPWGSAVGKAMLDLGHSEPPAPDAPGPFRLADPDRLRALVGDAGFPASAVEDVPIAMRYASFDEFWDVTRDLAMTLRTVLARLSETETEELRRRVAAALDAYRDADGLAIPGLARVVSSTRL